MHALRARAGAQRQQEGQGSSLSWAKLFYVLEDGSCQVEYSYGHACYRGLLPAGVSIAAASRLMIMSGRTERNLIL